jgi:(p)ppGpp synthase/HD superfamily hydrolase
LIRFLGKVWYNKPMLEQKAKEFAAKVHFGQLRKYTGAMYITHPEAVAELVRSVPHTEEMLAAAWLHDVVEDCGVSHEKLVSEFGWYTAGIVAWLTDVSKPADGNRKLRKKRDLDNIAKAPREAKTIKLADIIDNTGSIVKYDPEFAKVYIPEKKALLEVLKDGDPTLWAKANDIVSR